MIEFFLSKRVCVSGARLELLRGSFFLLFESSHVEESYNVLWHGIHQSPKDGSSTCSYTIQYTQIVEIKKGFSVAQSQTYVVEEKLEEITETANEPIPT